MLFAPGVSGNSSSIARNIGHPKRSRRRWLDLFEKILLFASKSILTKWSGKLDFLMEFPFPLIPRNSTFPFPIVWNAILNSSFQLSGIGWVIPFPWIKKIIPAHPWFAHPLEVAIEQSSPSSQLVTLWIYWNLWPILPFFHYPRIDIRVDEVGMVGKPADGKDWDHQTKHLDYLKDLDCIQHWTVLDCIHDDLSTMTVLQSS